MNASKSNLYLLHCETFLLLKAKKETEEFDVTYAIPPDCEEQVPIFFNIRDDTSSQILEYKIRNDKYPPNKIVHFTIGGLKKNEIVKIHFDYIVIVKNKKYNDLPKFVKIPKKNELSKKIKIWLEPTKAVQSNNFLIKIKANLLKGFSKNMMWVLRKIIYYVPFHRFLLQQLRYSLEKNSILRSLFLPKKYWTGLCDAVSYLLFGGHCTGQANFTVALLRSIGIPSKVLIVTMFGLKYQRYEKCWLDSQHYMIESYCPGYGWIKSTPGRVGHQPKNYILLRIVYPADENIAGNGLSYYGGMEPWFWIGNDNVTLEFPEDFITFYKKPRGNVSGVPAHRLWTENKISVDNSTAEEIFPLVRNIWGQYIKCTNLKLSKSDKKYFNSAIVAQKQALNFFNKNDLNSFNKYLNIAYFHYKKIND